MANTAGIYWNASEWVAYDSDPDGEADTIVAMTPGQGGRGEVLGLLIAEVVSQGYVIDRIETDGS